MPAARDALAVVFVLGFAALLAVDMQAAVSWTVGGMGMRFQGALQVAAAAVTMGMGRFAAAGFFCRTLLGLVLLFPFRIQL